MQQFENLPKAPIIEALGQINFQSASDISRFDQWTESLRPELSEDIMQIQVPVTGEPTRTRIGKRIRLENGRIIIQATQHYLSVSQNRGYEDWDRFAHRLSGVFDSLLQRVEVRNITRTALRYINQFNFDAAESPSSYLTQVAPKAIGRDFVSRNTHLTVSYEVPRIAAEAVVNQSIELQHASSRWVATIDIDVFSAKSIKPELTTVMNELTELRLLKNTVFHSLITETCRAQFR